MIALLNVEGGSKNTPQIEQSDKRPRKDSHTFLLLTMITGADVDRPYGSGVRNSDPGGLAAQTGQDRHRLDLEVPYPSRLKPGGVDCRNHRTSPRSNPSFFATTKGPREDPSLRRTRRPSPGGPDPDLGDSAGPRRPGASTWVAGGGSGGTEEVATSTPGVTIGPGAPRLWARCEKVGVFRSNRRDLGGARSPWEPG